MRALRVSPKDDKPSPRIVYREGKQDKQIREPRDSESVLKPYQATGFCAHVVEL